MIIIAEIAQGFEGNPHQAALLVRAAAAGGADGVKLQLVYADELCTADYKHHALFKSLEMPDAEWVALREHCRDLRLDMYLDVFGERSLRLAEELQVAGIKIHSTDMANAGFLRKVAASNISKILLSAGGCHATEIDAALAPMAGKTVILMHGFQGYPTRNEDNQLARIAALRERYGRNPGVELGFADHVPTDDAMRFVLPVLAAGLGVRYLEKHITLGAVMKIEDHESALNPDEFALCVSQLRRCVEAMGATATDPERDDFAMSASEAAYRRAMHKHVVAAQALPAGTLLTADAIAMKRTSAPDAIYDPARVLGKRLAEAVAADQPITAGMVTD